MREWFTFRLHCLCILGAVLMIGSVRSTLISMGLTTNESPSGGASGRSRLEAQNRTSKSAARQPTSRLYSRLLHSSVLRAVSVPWQGGRRDACEMPLEHVVAKTCATLRRHTLVSCSSGTVAASLHDSLFRPLERIRKPTEAHLGAPTASHDQRLFVPGVQGPIDYLGARTYPLKARSTFLTLPQIHPANKKQLYIIADYTH